MLENYPHLQAKTALNYLIDKYPNMYSEKLARSMRRRIKDWRALYGADKEVMFKQVHHPGIQSQSDYTHMDKLGITIGGNHFKHLLYHFRLSYSKWEDVMICLSETFDSLAMGFEKAASKLGGMTQEHRTDNLSAAKKHHAGFTQNWTYLTQHYQVKPTTNNPGKSNENGMIEKSHHLLKTAIAQELIIRGSNDFSNIAAYQVFLDTLVAKRNQQIKSKVDEERLALKKLPASKWYSPKTVSVKVSNMSTVQIKTVIYSVPSRLIKQSLNAHIYPGHIDLFYGKTLIQRMPKQASGVCINYRHLITSLLKKPGAFANYQYQTCLFPNLSFRYAYDNLGQVKPYLQLLFLAKNYSQSAVTQAIDQLLANKQHPIPEQVEALLKNQQKTIPPLIMQEMSNNTGDYNSLLTLESYQHA